MKSAEALAVVEGTGAAVPDGQVNELERRTLSPQDGGMPQTTTSQQGVLYAGPASAETTSQLRSRLNTCQHKIDLPVRAGRKSGV